MTGKLDEVLKTLITTGLPGLFSGPAPVKITVSSDLFEIDPRSADTLAGEPRPEDRTDAFPFDPGNPAGPYNLTQSPYPGPRRVYLTTTSVDRIPVSENEVILDEVDSRRFTLALRPGRELTGITGVLALYGITAIFTKLKGIQTLTVELESTDAARLNEAEALTVAVIELNRSHFAEAAQATFEDGDYGVDIEIKSLKLLKGAAAATQRLLTLQAEVELKARRALREDEGKPIKVIRTPGRPTDPGRPVDIDFELNV